VLSASVRRSRSMLGYAVGLLLGAALSALVVLTLGSLLWGAVQAPAAARTALLGAIAIGLAVRELGLVDFPLPQNQRLVPESVFGLKLVTDVDVEGLTSTFARRRSDVAPHHDVGTRP
jgi:hypothetical protein